MDRDDQSLSKDIRTMRELVEHLLSDFKESFVRDTIMWRPATDVYETERELVVRMDLAGIRKEDMSVLKREMVRRGQRKDKKRAFMNQTELFGILIEARRRFNVSERA